MITLFSSTGCPYAHRTRALLEHLGEGYENREVDLDNRDPELLKLSPTGKVPFLLDGDFKLFESALINDYLAEKHGFETAYAESLELRMQQKLIMRQWDSAVLPAFYRSLGDPEYLNPERKAAIRRELAYMAEVVERSEGEQGELVRLHFATHWARIDWLREFSGLAALVDEHPSLRQWLDSAAALPAIEKTLPDREETVARYRRRFAGST
ncbi:MAG: glutathione S-transferase family protein [Planctomycetota bacterium]|jgi:glutathione S-transferase